jgi:hypothetical protein
VLRKAYTKNDASFSLRKMKKVYVPLLLLLPFNSTILTSNVALTLTSFTLRVNYQTVANEPA